MEQLKKIGQVCRQHYEKLILIAALLLLAAAVVYLYQASQEEERQETEKPKEAQRKSAKGVPPVNLAPFEAALQEATNPPALGLSGKHNLFNPVKWQQARPGTPAIKVETGREMGVESVQIVRITPLSLSIAFDRAATSGTAPRLDRDRLPHRGDERGGREPAPAASAAVHLPQCDQRAGLRADRGEGTAGEPDGADRGLEGFRK